MGGSGSQVYLRVEHIIEGPARPAPFRVAGDLALAGSVVALVRIHHSCGVAGRQQLWLVHSDGAGWPARLVRCRQAVTWYE